MCVAAGEAQAKLQQAAQMQRHYSTNDRYTATATGTTAEADQVSPPPSGLDQSPGSGAAAYTVTVRAVDNLPTYTLRAAPTGSMSNDRCGTLTLTSQSVKGVTGAATGVAPGTDCWR